MCLLEKMFQEYFMIKYILITIPVYVSFVLFTIDQGSLIELSKILVGYIAVFSAFFLLDEDMYFIIKSNIGKLLVLSGGATAILMGSTVILGFLDNIIINLLKSMGVELIPFHLLIPLINFSDKMLISSFLFMLCFFMNVVILFIIIKLNLSNKILSYINQMNEK